MDQPVEAQAAAVAGQQKDSAELEQAQGPAVDLGGYYQTDPVKVEKAMRPSSTLNSIIG